jgi:cob(I)alamin adenosyltransferase
MNNSTIPTSKDERHKNRMQRKKEVVDEGIARATEDRGIIVVNTGNGKGKSSSAFGMVARALGHKMRVGIIQFIKAPDTSGEEAFFRDHALVDYHVMGEGFTWETQDRNRDIETASAAWAQANKFLTDQSFALVVLDELNIAIKSRYIPIDSVITALLARPPMQHVIITGRAALPELIDIADTVTVMQESKHAYKAGVRAQKGIEL